MAEAGIARCFLCIKASLAKDAEHYISAAAVHFIGLVGKLSSEMG